MRILILIFLFLFFSCITSNSSADILNIRVDNFSDVNGSYIPGVNSRNLVIDTNFCISSVLNLKYIIKFSSANAKGTTFRVKNSSKKYLPYTVNFYPNSSATGTSYPMQSDVVSTIVILNIGLGLIGGLLPNCSINNITTRLTFLQTDLDTATAGNYSDILTIVVYLQPI